MFSFSHCFQNSAEESAGEEDEGEKSAKIEVKVGKKAAWKEAAAARKAHAKEKVADVFNILLK